MGFYEIFKAPSVLIGACSTARNPFLLIGFQAFVTDRVVPAQGTSTLKKAHPQARIEPTISLLQSMPSIAVLQLLPLVLVI